MSDNVKLVQGLYEAFGRGEIGAIAQAMTADYTWRVAGDKRHYPTAGVWRGANGVTEFFSLVAQTQDPLEFSPREFHAAGDRVFVLGHYKWKLKKNGQIAEADFVHIFTVRDGKVSAFSEFTDTATFADAFRG